MQMDGIQLMTEKIKKHELRDTEDIVPKDTSTGKLAHFTSLGFRLSEPEHLPTSCFPRRPSCLKRQIPLIKANELEQIMSLMTGKEKQYRRT
jgi:hypothetical protein